MKKIIIFILFTSIISKSAFSQSLVTITGYVYDNENKTLPLYKLMVINQRTNNGVFATADGKFSITAKQTDTILFSAIGFLLTKISLRDSIFKKQYYVEIPMRKLQYTLKEISVFATRDLNDIEKDINKLGIKHHYEVTGANAFESPITALYERFSKLEKSKRKVAEWENKDLREQILKDLFRLYIKNDIIDLPDEEFDAFIKYLNLSDEYIQDASQFELTTAIKGKYESFKYRWK